MPMSAAGRDVAAMIAIAGRIHVAPALRGNGPSGQPYHYVWKWHSFYHASELGSNQSGAWGPFYNDHWNSAVAPSGDTLKTFPINLGGYFFQTVFDRSGAESRLGDVLFAGSIGRTGWWAMKFSMV